MTHLILLLDKSSSMLETKAITLQTLNEAQTQYQQQLPPDSRYTIATFSSHQEPLLTYIFSNELLTNIHPISPEEYQPSGLTALYDALFSLLTTFENNNERTIVLIITDGQENDSRNHTREHVFDKINKLRVEKQWEFVFMGANQDAYSSGSSIGIHYNIEYQQDLSMPQLMRSVSHAISDVSRGDTTRLQRISSPPHKIARHSSDNIDISVRPILKRSYSHYS